MYSSKVISLGPRTGMSDAARTIAGAANSDAPIPTSNDLRV